MKRCHVRPLSLPVHPVRAYRRFLLFGTTILILLGLCGVGSPTHAASSSIQKLVAGGDPTPLGGVFASDGTPAIGLGVSGLDNVGATVFFAYVDEGSSSLGIFQAVENTITKVAAVGDPTPLGGTFSSFSGPVQNRAGEVAFSATIADGNAIQGVFLFSRKQLMTIAALGKNSSFKELASFPVAPALNNRGEVAFRALLPDDEEGRPGIFLATSDSEVNTIVADNDLTSTGGRLSILSEDTLPLAFNDSGGIALSTTVKDNSEPPGIFTVSKSGQVTKVVTVGDPTPRGGTFRSLTHPGFNNAGAVVFGAEIADGAVSQGIFLAAQGQVKMVVGEGDPAPGGGQFTLSVGMSLPPILNDQGEVAFNANILSEGETDEIPGVFVFSQGQIAEAVVAGDLSPLGGTFLGGPITFQFDNDGTVLFLSSVDTDEDGRPNTQGIFVVRPSAS